MVFVRGVSVSTLNVSTNVQSSVETFKTLLEERSSVSRCHWHLTYAGRPLIDGKQLHDYGISADSTVQLAFRVLGGKGGFGSLLRGAGRAILTDNVDACRDLSGRRLRQANAEKRLAQWAAEARERELEKVAMKHVKEQEKANKREERAQIDSEAIRREQQEAMDRVTAAVIAAQEVLAGGTLESGKRKASLQVTDKPAKRTRIFGLDELSDSETDSEDDEELFEFEKKAAQLAAAGSSGLDSTVSDQEAAHHLEDSTSKEFTATAGPSQDGQQSSTTQPTQSGAAAAESSQPLPAVQQPGIGPAQHASNPAPVKLPLQSPGVDSNADASAIQEPATASKLATGLPASATESQTTSSQKQVKENDSAFVKSPPVTAQQSQEPPDIGSFDSAQQLETVGMDRMKAELQRHGMKCGGTMSERAARLFLLKSTSVKHLDRKHLAKP